MPEFNYKKSKNVSGESIRGAAVICGWDLTFLSEMRRLFE